MKITQISVDLIVFLTALTMANGTWWQNPSSFASPWSNNRAFGVRGGDDGFSGVDDDGHRGGFGGQSFDSYPDHDDGQAFQDFNPSGDDHHDGFQGFGHHGHDGQDWNGNGQDQCYGSGHDSQSTIQTNDCYAALKSYDPKGTGMITFKASFNQKSCSTCQIEVRADNQQNVNGLRYDEVLQGLQNFMSYCPNSLGKFNVGGYEPVTVSINRGSGRLCPRY